MRLALGFSLALFVVSSAIAQTQTASDPQALSLAAQSIAAMTGGTSISDGLLTASAIRIAGSDYLTGSATLKVRAPGQSRLDLSFNGRSRSEILVESSGTADGAWSDDSGTKHRMAVHNCWTETAWFFPPLSMLAEANRPDMVLSYLGSEQRNGLSVYHLRSYRLYGKPGSVEADLMRRVSTMDFYLDFASLLPLAITFNIHPDNDSNVDIRTEVRFADYRAVNGVLVPFRIQRLVNDGLVLDLTVTNATINAGLLATDFSLQ